MNYLLFLPKGYEAKAGKRWPLILFLHGAGERGTNVWKVAIARPPKNVAAHPDFPFIVVSPQCPEREIWSKDVLLALLDEVIAQLRGGHEPGLPDRPEHGRLRHLGSRPDATRRSLRPSCRSAAAAR